MLLFIPVVVAVAAVWGLVELFSDVGEIEESNCSPEFLEFDKNLSIIPSKKEQVDAARNVLQEKIRKYFSSKTTTSKPTFYIQGSYKQGTMIRKQDDTCDVDVGVYFQKKPGILPLAIQANIVSAFEVHTNERPITKDKCVRIPYSTQFHIDLPVYYCEKGQYYIGMGKSNTWRLDDPRLFTNWLKENTSDNPQKIRLIKYFKAWADVTKRRLGQTMPSGLALTIWIVKYYEGDNREDVSFLKTAMALRNDLKDLAPSKWECKMPTIPGDNVIAKLNSEQRKNFLSALNTLIEDASKIVASTSKEECIASWRYIFGKWF